LLTEFIEVTQRRKIKKYLETDEVLDAINILKRHAERVQVTSEVNECEDPDDNFLLALCKDGNANYLVTGDKLLLRFKSFHSTEVISLRSYFEGTT